MLHDAITRAGGWISFATFMDLALYAPGLGYYAAGARKFGAAGDFITAPEISPLFGQAIAQSISDTITQTQGSVLELGPGSGQLAFDMLVALEQLKSLPSKYYLLEVSADLRARQREKLSSLPVHLFQRCVWFDALPIDFIGAIVANEVLDVVPTHLVKYENGVALARGVALGVAKEGGKFIYQDVPNIPADVAAMVEAVNRDVFANVFANTAPDNYLTEFAPQAAALTTSLCQALKTGVMLLIDYGFRRQEYYHPTRVTGTLMCHYRHFAHTDPFLYPGLQDITAHVDFTAIAEAGIAADCELLGYTTQANFLLSAGIADAIAQHDPSDTARYLAITNQAQRLLSPAEMGEFFKVIGFGKGGQTIDALTNARQLPL
jgi:SAM-dependent MidA family methyltransferase